MIHIILLRIPRNHQQRQTRAVTAASVLAGSAHLLRTRRPAVSGSEQLVIGNIGLVHDGSHHVVVPAVGVVVRDDHRGFLPLVDLLQRVDRAREEDLLVERIGVACMPVLNRARLQEANRRHVVRLDRIPEIGDVVLMVCCITLVSDHRHRGSRRVLGVQRRLPILEKCMVRNVISGR